MKPFLLLALFISLCCFSNATAQTGSSCANPKILTVNDSVCVYEVGTGRESSTVFDSISPAFFNNQKIKPREKVWYKFTASSKNNGIMLRDTKYFTVVVYTGNCGSMTQIGAFSSYLPNNSYIGQVNEKETLFGAIENLTLGQDYYILVTSTITPFDNAGPVCLFKIPDVGRRIISKPQGGSWLSKSTWLQGRIPTPIDTATISDGSTVVVDAFGIYAMKRLEVGQGGVGVARLLCQENANQYTIYGDLVITNGDSIVGLKNAIGGDRFALYGNLINHGIFSFQKKILSSTRRPSFCFRSIVGQTVSGSGSFLGCGIPSLIIDNPEGVKWNMDGYCKSQIYLKRGLFDNSASNFAFFSDTANGDNGFNSSLSVENGTISKLLTNINTITNWFKSNTLYYAQITDNDLQSNRQIDLDDYYPVGTRFLQLELKKWSGKKVIVNRSLLVRTLNMQNNGVLQGSASDSLMNSICNFGTVSSIQHAEFGHYRNYDPRNTDWSVPAWSGGKGRSFRLKSYFVNSVGLQWMHARVLNQAPSGTFSAPVSFLMGPHVLEIKANAALGPGAKLQIEVLDSDSMPGLKSQWRLVQGPSPAGPWTVVDVTNTFVDPADPLLDAIFTTTNPISLANGNYFAFASTGQASEAVLTRVLPVATYPFGCGGSQTTTVKMLVTNSGLSSLSNLLVGAIVAGNFYSRSYVTGVNWTNSLAVGGVDTFRFEIPGTLSGNLPIKYFVSAPADGNRANDTIKTYLYTTPRPLPFYESFDTCQYMRLQGLGLNKFGHPIVNGWENGPKGAISNSGSYGNSFISAKDANSSSFYLRAELFMPNGSGMLRTSEYGPIGSSSWFRYKFNIVDVDGTTNEIRSGDTIWIEASGNCGQSYTRLRTINKGNSIAYMDPTGGQMLDGLGPISEWKDSLPFPAGSLVHFRIRMKGPTGFSNGIFYMDDFQVKDSIQVGNAPLQLANSDLLLYPNPAGEEVFFQLPEGETAGAIRLVDLLGRETHLEADAENRIALKGIAKGIYTLEVTGRQKTWMKRLLKE